MSSDVGAVFITYNGLLDPLGPSQILPYVERLARDRKMRIVSFERGERWSDAAASAMTERLRRQRIAWSVLRYRKRPSILAKTLDLWDGVRAVKAAIRDGAGIMHARGYMPMEIALRASKKIPVLFDIRGLQGEEYLDAGIWTAKDLRFKLLKRSEREFFRHAAAAVVLTKAIEPYVRDRFAEFGRQPPLEVIPSAVDLERFRFDPKARAVTRASLGAGDRVVFIYSGSLGTWYLAHEMARFVRTFRDVVRRDVLLFWQVNNDAELARRASEDAGLTALETRISGALPSEVPGQLAAADVGLALIKACFSKRSSSPTKYGEYLAVGLPVVMTREVGDSADLETEGAGIALRAPFDADEMRDACVRLASLLGRQRDEFRNVAVRKFDIESVAMPAYRRLYAAMAAL